MVDSRWSSANYPRNLRQGREIAMRHDQGPAISESRLTSDLTAHSIMVLSMQWPQSGIERMFVREVSAPKRGTRKGLQACGVQR